MLWPPGTVVCLLFALAGVAASLAAVARTLRHFTLDKTVFFAAFLDCFVSLLCSLALATALSLRLLELQVHLACKLFFATNYVMMYFGSVLTALIAGLRCLSLLRPMSQDESVNRVVAGTVMLTVGLLPPVAFFSHQLSVNRPFGLLDDTCEHESSEVDFSGSQSLFIGPSLILPSVISLLLDLFLVRQIRKTVLLEKKQPARWTNDQTEQEKEALEGKFEPEKSRASQLHQQLEQQQRPQLIVPTQLQQQSERQKRPPRLRLRKDRIPVQATVFSAVCVGVNCAFWAIAGVLTRSLLSVDVTGNVLAVAVCALTPLRAPATLVFTFARGKDSSGEGAAAVAGEMRDVGRVKRLVRMTR